MVDSLVLGQDRSLDDERLLHQLDDEAAAQQPAGGVELLPFDDELTYSNQHPFATMGVFGVAGGPPLGLRDVPHCPDCRRLMFHVATVATSLREYGEGFRALFICEDCRTSASVGTLWN